MSKKKQYGNMKKVMKGKVLKAFLDYKMVGVKKPHLTARDLAKRVGCTPSTYFNNVLSEMVDDNALALIPQTHWNGWPRNLYALPDDAMYQRELPL